MLQVDPKKKTDKGSGEFTLDYWKPSQKIMGKSKFLDRLRNYDKDNIPTKIVKTVRETYMPLEGFQPEIVKRASSAAEGMCKWVRKLKKSVMVFLFGKVIDIEEIAF